MLSKPGSLDEEIRVLDVGCGNGSYHKDIERYLERRLDEEDIDYESVEVVGMDLNHEAMQGVNAVVYDATLVSEKFGWPFRDNSFDMVVSNKLMPNIESGERDLVIRESERVAKNLDAIGHGSYHIP